MSTGFNRVWRVWNAVRDLGVNFGSVDCGPFLPTRVPPPASGRHGEEYDMEHDARSCKSLKSKQQFAISLAVVLCGLLIL